MLTIPWSSTSGWGAPKISAYAPLELDPSSTVLHYAPCLFEGMKAYKDTDGVARLFRPDKNMERMNRSASRLAFPVCSLTAVVVSIVVLTNYFYLANITSRLSQTSISRLSSNLSSPSTLPGFLLVLGCLFTFVQR